MLKASADAQFPYRYREGRRVFDKKVAGVTLKINLTVGQAEALIEILQVVLDGVKEHIEKGESRK